MNFVQYIILIPVRILKIHNIFYLSFSILLSICIAGCSDQVHLPSPQELAEFENAGPPLPITDIEHPDQITSGSAIYHVSPGEVLEITMPTILQVVTVDEPSGTEQVTPYLCRVSEKGTITLPVVGEIEAAGKTLAQIESAIIDLYYPEYTANRPYIFVRLVEKIEPFLFSVLGLVKQPGNFPYPPDIKYNLMQALAFAGGLDQTAEPRYATIYRLKQNGTIVSAIFQVANTGDSSMLAKALNIRLKPGDIVDVVHTPRTRTKLFLNNLFGINIGAYYRLDEVWDN